MSANVETPIETPAAATTPTPTPAEPSHPPAAPLAAAEAASAAIAAESKEDTKPDVDEPQNSLTEKFTPEEWTALKELRTKLPDIWRAAYTPDDKTADSKPFNIWGIDIDPKNPTSDARVSVVLMKFLRARELKVKDAETMFVATLRWRDELKVDEIMKEEFPEKVFGGVGRVFGQDKEGNPVTYNIYGGGLDMKEVFGDVRRFIRWRVQLMEKTVRLLDFSTHDQMLQVHDYEGVSVWAGRDPNQKAAAAEATNIFQNHYPEFLARKFFINVPSLLTWMFWFFKSILSAKTFAKMSVVGTGKHTIAAALLPFIDAKQLPKRYGGEADAF